MQRLSPHILGLLLAAVLTSCGVPVQTVQTTPSDIPAYPAPQPAITYPDPVGPTPTPDPCTPIMLGVSPCDPDPTPPPTIPRIQESYPLPGLPPASERPTVVPPPYPARERITSTSYIPNPTYIAQPTPTYEPTVWQTTTNTVILTIGDSIRDDPREVSLRVGHYLQIKRPFHGPDWRLTYDSTRLTLVSTTSVDTPPAAGWKWQATAQGSSQIDLILIYPCVVGACSPGYGFTVNMQIVP